MYFGVWTSYLTSHRGSGGAHVSFACSHLTGLNTTTMPLPSRRTRAGATNYNQRPPLASLPTSAYNLLHTRNLDRQQQLLYRQHASPTQEDETPALEQGGPAAALRNLQSSEGSSARPRTCSELCGRSRWYPTLAAESMLAEARSGPAG